MSFQVAVLKETQPLEQRVALVPAVADQLSRLGGEITVQSGAGEASRLPDSLFKNVKFLEDPAQIVRTADVLLAVQPPPLEVVQAMKPGAILISFIYANHEAGLVKLLRDRNITCFAMELIPRISRAQAMDALSSQAALAGYYSLLLGATNLHRILPMMTTAAGTLRPATVLVLGLGVAGLQALATARRLGALLEGYDVRPECKEEAASLGARFVDTGVSAVGEGGYARELTEAEREQVAQTLTRHIQKADLVITTASVPGRPAPKLISRAQVDGMKPGAVIVDLAADGGGNCECTEPGKTTRRGAVTIVGPINVPSLLGEHASELYAKNQLNLLKLMIHEKALEIDWQDEVLRKSVLTHQGEIRNEAARQLVEGALQSGTPVAAAENITGTTLQPAHTN